MNRFAVLLILGLLLPVAPAAADDDTLSAAANQSYLAANAARPGVVSRPDGLQYRILGTGFGKRPGPADMVQIAYAGKLINGKVFDGTSPGLPVSVSVLAMIHGMSEALQMMHAGERWQVVIPASLGFGPAGAANGAVPPNQTLVFDVTLVSVAAAPLPGGQDPGIGFGVTSTSPTGGRDKGGRAVLSFPQ